MSEEPRSAEARARAEQALVWLAAGLDGAEVELIVLGGLVPEVLTRGVGPGSVAHLGTTDVDLLLVTHIDQDADLGVVEARLKDLGFAPEGDGWRWRGPVEGRPVKIEFLCDLEAAREEDLITPVGCEELRAVNLRGTGYVASDWKWEELRATGPEGETLEVKMKFAGLGGYLLAKMVAARTRAAGKDFYDFAYVLIHNRAGGPREAAALLQEGELAGAVNALRSTFLEVGARFTGSSSQGARCYGEQMLLADPEQQEAVLRTDAATAVAEFLEALGFDAQV